MDKSPHSSPPHSAPHSHGKHGHTHTFSSNTDKRYLWSALALASIFMLAEITAGYFSSSLVLLSDAVDKFSDIGAIGIALWVSHIAQRPAQGKWTYGFRRAEVLSGTFNSLTILIVAFAIIVKAIHKLMNPSDVIGIPVLATALVGIFVNLMMTWLLSRADRTNLNIRGAYQHIATDLYASIATALAGIVIITTGWKQADSIASLIVAILMIRATWSILRDAIPALMEASPSHIEPEEIRAKLMECSYVDDIHDLHVWTVDSGTPLVSAHVSLNTEVDMENYRTILDDLQECLLEHFGITHSTFQYEPSQHASPSPRHREEHQQRSDLPSHYCLNDCFVGHNDEG